MKEPPVKKTRAPRVAKFESEKQRTTLSDQSLMSDENYDEDYFYELTSSKKREIKEA